MSEKKRILIVDDEPNIRRTLQVAFEKAGYQAYIAEDAYTAEEILGEQEIDCVLTDVTMPGKTGYELLKDLKDSRPELPVVIMTAFGTIPQAIQAIRDGAFEYVTKPFDLDSLKKVIASAIEDDQTQSAQSSSKGKRKGSSPKHVFLAESPEMKEVEETIKQVADSRATVLITGESGAGKEVVAKSLHAHSSRSNKPFVAISCAALPETLLESELFGYEKGAFTGANGSKVGRFEMAHEGTLFLDEIGDIPPLIQVKLLRVLQEREFERLGSNKPTKVDVRLIAATNRDLKTAVDEGTFRLDLLYRLQVVELHIPPLRDRVKDIIPLAQLFLKKYADENGKEPMDIDDDAQKALLAYNWPGNVRELENVIERAVVMSSDQDKALNKSLLPVSLREAA